MNAVKIVRCLPTSYVPFLPYLCQGFTTAKTIGHCFVLSELLKLRPCKVLLSPVWPPLCCHLMLCSVNLDQKKKGCYRQVADD